MRFFWMFWVIHNLYTSCGVDASRSQVIWPTLKKGRERKVVPSCFYAHGDPSQVTNNSEEFPISCGCLPPLRVTCFSLYIGTSSHFLAWCNAWISPSSFTVFFLYLRLMPIVYFFHVMFLLQVYINKFSLCPLRYLLGQGWGQGWRTRRRMVCPLSSWSNLLRVLVPLGAKAVAIIFWLVK